MIFTFKIGKKLCLKISYRLFGNRIRIYFFFTAIKNFCYTIPVLFFQQAK